jgi:hypothetical protein
MTIKYAERAAEKASSRRVFEPSSQDRRKNWRYFRVLLILLLEVTSKIHSTLGEIVPRMMKH